MLMLRRFLNTKSPANNAIKIPQRTSIADDYLTNNEREVSAKGGSFAFDIDAVMQTAERIPSSRQLTDFYLLALAAKHRGMLATFDQGIPISAVKIAGVKNLCVL
jgi:hypothetical protein